MIIRNFWTDFGAHPGGPPFHDLLPICQAVSQEIAANPYVPYKLIIPAGDYYIGGTWEIPSRGQTVIIEGEIGTGHGTVFHPHSNFNPLVTLGTNYVPFVRYPGTDSFSTPKDPSWTIPLGWDPALHLHRDYRPLIRLRALGEGSVFRGIAINGRDENKTARLGKGLWIDGLWQPDDSGYDPVGGKISNTYVFHGSNGLLIDSCKVNSVYAVAEVANNAFGEFLPWLPAIAVQAGSASSDGATRQISNVRIHRSYVFGALGGPNDRTDLGILFAAGNMKNYMVSECNIGFCKYGIRTAGSGYTNVTGCDFAANGSDDSHWPDGADLLIPQAQVNIIGCGSEGSRRLVRGDGAPSGFGALNIDACYWDGILALDRPLEDIGYVIRNLNQAAYIRGLRVVTGGSASGGAGKAAIQIHPGVSRSLVLVNSHLDGVSIPLGDPLIYDDSNFLPSNLEELAAYQNENVRIFVQNCTSRGYNGVFPTDVVPLQNYDFSGVKRIGGNSVKVTLASDPKKDVVLEPWHHTIVADATLGTITVLLPEAKPCQGREYVIKRMDDTATPANFVIVKGAINTEKVDGSTVPLSLKNLQACRLVSSGTRGWVVVES